MCGYFQCRVIEMRRKCVIHASDGYIQMSKPVGAVIILKIEHTFKYELNVYYFSSKDGGRLNIPHPACMLSQFVFEVLPILRRAQFWGTRHATEQINRPKTRIQEFAQKPLEPRGGFLAVRNWVAPQPKYDWLLRKHANISYWFYGLTTGDQCARRIRLYLKVRCAFDATKSQEWNYVARALLQELAAKQIARTGRVRREAGTTKAHAMPVWNSRRTITFAASAIADTVTPSQEPNARPS
ncbi:hypothetical protein C8J57DRAFT_1224349 [Mycena rebaudengoi]|nr:hypothetical protein C8J57DRAFT_1224349 [Mycena rebaudengoi]